MNRRTIQLSIASLCLLGGIYYHSTQLHQNVLNDLAFENMEALASSEDDPDGNYLCFGWGDIDCYGEKVARKTTGLR